MADQKCPVCGKKMGGVFGQPEPSENLLERAKKFDVPCEGMCQICLAEAVDKQQTIASETISAERKEAERIIQTAISKMFVTPAQPVGGRDLGAISGYSVIGTGAISELLSSWTDFFGMQSNTYLGKIRTAEEYALNMLKLEALKRGGDSIYCYSINLTEATSGHGMLMVSVCGSAVNKFAESGDCDIIKAIEVISKQ